MEEKLLSGEDMTEDPLTKSHAKWAADIADELRNYSRKCKEIVQKETGIVFQKFWNRPEFTNGHQKEKKHF